MEAKDLMIGDWVFAENIPAKITSMSILGGDTIGVLQPFMSNEIVYSSNKTALERGAKDINNIKPIQLTQEILEKNGFKSCEFYGELTIDNWRIMCDCINIAILNEDHMFLDIPIKWVHELQHALKLCGIEKEITL